MCKTSSTPIINKGPGPIDNTIVNDQSTSLINFHEKYPIATMLLFGLLVLIVYFVHRKYCTKKAAAKPDDQPALTAPATMIPTAPMPPPSVLFPLQQHLNLQQPFHIQPFLFSIRLSRRDFSNFQSACIVSILCSRFSKALATPLSFSSSVFQEFLTLLSLIHI